MRRDLACAILIAAASCSGAAHGTLTVYRIDGSEATPQQATVTYNAKTGGWDVVLSALYAPGEFTVYHVVGDGGETIDNLLIDVPCHEPPPGQCLPGSPVIVNVVSGGVMGIDSVCNILQTGTAETILGDLDIHGDLGRVAVQDIGILSVGGDVLGPVHATITGAPGRGINMIEVEGDILGDVTARDGRIIFILAYGRIGTDAQPVVVEARHDIIQIASYGGIHADVNTRVNGGQGRLFAFGTFDFVGSLETESLFTNPYSGMVGRIRVLERFDGVIRIGKSFDDPAQWIEVPAGGLGGQIIINADGAPGGVWSAPVSVGEHGHPDTVVIDGPGYDETAQSLGGGSVGLVPFDLHDESCVPPADGVVSGDAPVSVRLRHYGPVRLAGTPAVRVERRAFGTADPYLEVDADELDVATDAADPNSIVIEPAPGRIGFAPGYDYRITPTDGLVSNAPGLPPVAWTGSYRFSIEPRNCPTDLDGSGVVDYADIILVLAAWGPCPGCPEDLDDDGSVTFADVLILIRAWGECP